MSWATKYIEELQEGKTVKFTPFGNSMEPLIHSGQLVTVAPVNLIELKQNDIVLCSVRGTHYLHIVKHIEVINNKLYYVIGNNKGNVNGVVTGDDIFGILTCVKR
jgi:phage repressor protein C with HTH and peptisase S24 domain